MQTQVTKTSTDRYTKKETEGKLKAAPDQALHTRWRKNTLRNRQRHQCADCVARGKKQHFIFCVSVAK